MRRKIVLCIVLGLTPASVQAAPQGGVSLFGGAVAPTRDLSSVGPYLALRGDLLAFRQRPNRVDAGLYLHFATNGFRSFEPGGGLECLLPVGDTAVIAAAGPFGQATLRGWAAGGAASVFWGSRSFNYHSSYSLALGLFAEARYVPSANGDEMQAIVGAQVDLQYLALPFLLAYQAVTR